MVLYTMNDMLRTQPDRSIICHQVNCRGVMGRGLAKAIREKYPLVYEQYMQDYQLGVLQLGYVSYVQVEPTTIVANLCGQYDYGTDGVYTDYDALYICFEDVKAKAKELGYTVLLPHGIGCGLAGGDWEIVSRMIDDVFHYDSDVLAVICEKGEDEDGENGEKSKTNHKILRFRFLGKENITDF